MGSLKANRLTKSFSNQSALIEVGFSIPKGRITGLLGPNGAGKTTTMRLLTGFLEPDTGTVSYGDISLSEDPIQIKRNLGYLPEWAPIYQDLTAQEYLEFIGRARGLQGGILQHRIREMRELCDLGDHFFSEIGTLSKGFKQRVALAGTLIHDPEYIILDEPSSGLDPIQIGQIRSIIRSFGKEKVLVLSTHILQEVEEICDHVLILHKGRLIADVSVKDINRGDSILLIAKTDLETLGHCFKNTDIEILESKNIGEATEFHLRSNTHSSEFLFERIRSATFPVLEFRPVRRTLESVFQELTAIS
ncbi:ABC transporter, ATP-binding protein [Leptospira fainei serovar Hurstbridge str. BUT 6]|uniref:ABC transporter, ATP-binding protein n=1 Tax=Leptospira fainei serovar Hurstbridge str. BUT 6 TaxID=1193011 RepID=S3V5Z5_9LEPT|nr:ATP-binding cassette domain-containing protein [Leptospira fainei]EPG76059.1 ABC transporter, ATP-binding protein [Leptospira fainei serovar Hurstbridge str. BUT 6]